MAKESSVRIDIRTDILLPDDAWNNPELAIAENIRKHNRTAGAIEITTNSPEANDIISLLKQNKSAYAQNN